MRGRAILIAVLLATPGTALARPQGRAVAAEERAIARCIHQAARGKPWPKRTLAALRAQEGGWVGAEVRNRDGSEDLGPMQINSRWVARFSRLMALPGDQVRRWLRDEPCFNVEAARWIILANLAQTRSYWLAVAAYHSPIARLQANYVIAVSRRIEAQQSALLSLRPDR